MSAENYLAAALKGTCVEIISTSPGNQAQKLYEGAYRLGRLVVEQDLDACWLETVKRDLVQSGLGMANSPDREPWTEAAVRNQVVNGIRDATSTRRYAPEGLQKAEPPACRTEMPELPLQRDELRRYTYSANRSSVLIKVRFKGEPKFRPFYRDVGPDGLAFWNPHKPSEFHYVPYGLDELKASQGKTVYITEGERDADTLRSIGLCATTFGSAGFWPPGAEMYFTGRDVFVIGDNDDAGQRHIETITGKLNGVASSVRSWIPTGGAPGYDVTDWLRDHPGADILKAIAGEQERRSTSNVVALVTGLSAQEQAGPVIVIPQPTPLKVNSRFLPRQITAEDKLESQEWLVDGIFPRRGYALIYGASGHGKSFIGIDLALAVQNALRWGGRDVRQGEVVYIAAEDPFGLHARVSAQLRANKDGLAGFHLIKEPVNLIKDSRDVAEVISAIKEGLGGKKPALIVIDTFQRVAGGADENNASEVMGVVGNVDAITQEFNCLVVLVHHVGKTPSGPRGSSVFKDAADAVVEVKKSGESRTLYLEKLRNGRADVEAAFELESADGIDGVRVQFLRDWGEGGGSPQKNNPGEGQSRQIQTAITEVLREAEATSGQPELTKGELRQHNRILSCLSHHKKPKSANDTFTRALRELVECGLVIVAGDRVTLVDEATNKRDLSPTVAALSPKAA